MNSQFENGVLTLSLDGRIDTTTVSAAEKNAANAIALFRRADEFFKGEIA